MKPEGKDRCASVDHKHTFPIDTPALLGALALGATFIPLCAHDERLAVLAVIPVGVLAGVLTWGVSTIRSGVFLRSFYQGDRARAEISLTFDDGPDPEWTPKVLDLLAARKVRATFFVIGRRVEAHPALAARLVAEGHEVGLHTFDHPLSYTIRSSRFIRDDLSRTRDALGAVGVTTPRWFRPPNGLLNPRIAQEVVRAGLDIAGWTVRPFDGIATAPDRVVQRVTSALGRGDVVLLHDARSPHGATHDPPGVLALPRILDAVEARGLVPVPLGELATLARWPSP